MQDEELERHIADCGRMIEDAMSRYWQTGKDEFRAEAQSWMNQMGAAVMARSSIKVNSLEADRGLF